MEWQDFKLISPFGIEKLGLFLIWLLVQDVSQGYLQIEIAA